MQLASCPPAAECGESRAETQEAILRARKFLRTGCDGPLNTPIFMNIGVLNVVRLGSYDNASCRPALPMSTALRNPPTPIFDNLEYIGNPFQLKAVAAGDRVPANLPIVGAEDDYDYALKFLYSYNGSTATFNAYRRELERLLQWAWYVNETSVVLLRREDIEAFIRFCQNPPLSWIGTKNVPRFLGANGSRSANKDWRPFVASISKAQFREGSVADIKLFLPTQAPVKATITALSSF